MTVGSIKFTVGLFFLMAIHASLAMEPANGEQQSNLSGSGQEGSLSVASYHLLPKDSFWALCDTLTQPAVAFYANNVAPVATSIYNTAKIKLDDEAVCKKLGYPVGDKYADNELHMTLENYKKFTELIKSSADVNSAYYTDKTVSEEFLRLKGFVARRLGFVERIADILPMRPDSLVLAHHCLTYHELVMNSFLKNIIASFIVLKQTSQEKSKACHKQVLSQLIVKTENDPDAD